MTTVNYTPSPTVVQMMRSNSQVRTIIGPVGCLPAETEFLSESGWVRMDKWRPGMKVAQWHQETKEVEWVHPEQFIRAPCAELIEFRNKYSLHMVVSDEHRMPLYDWNDKFVVKTGAEVERRPSRHIVPTTFDTTASGLPMSDNQVRYAVALQADGHITKQGVTVFTLRKERKKKRLRDLLNALGLEYREATYSGRPNETVFSFRYSYTAKTFGPEWYQASARQLDIVLSESLHWGGLHDHDEQRYYSTVKSNADFIQFAAHACGRRATINRYVSDNDRWAVTYIVQISTPNSPKGKVMLRGDTTEINRVRTSDGYKYCFTVPSSFFVARHNDRVFITGNSGKSVGCLMECVRRASMQEPGQDGIRRSRYIVVRNTVQQLKDTTIATFFDWFPSGAAGEWREQEKKFIMRFGDVYIEWLFRSLDRPEDTKKLLSLEFSGAYLNEARELPFEIYVGIKSRLGRYPPPKDGTPCSFPFVIMDTNPPDVDSWIYRLGEKEKTIEIFTQPPGMFRQPDGSYVANPAAENIANLPKNYYESMVQDADQEFIDVHVLAKYGASKAGKPVWPEYRPDMHLVPASIKSDPTKLVVIGMDFALNPAAVFKQQDTWGHVNNIAEAVGFDMGLERFIKTKMIPVVRERFVGSGYRFVVVGDPSGDFRTQITEQTPFDYLEELGFEVIAAPTNRIDPRISATKDLMMTLAGDMRPRWQVSQDCEYLVKAVSHGYRYPRKRDGSHGLSPEKNDFSHVADANQYGDMFFTYGLNATGKVYGDDDDFVIEHSGHVVADSTMGY